MKTIFTIMLFSLLTLSLNLTAQDKEQTFKIQQQAGVNNKAQELGITAEQLSGILNSVGNDGSIAGGEIEPDALTFTSFTGENDNDRFGESVSSAGDVNGDGYDDIIIGAPIYDDIYNEGKIYIYYGGPTMDYSPDITIIGENQDDRFGTCVSSAGDLNGDGYSDVIVGAPWFDSGGYTQNGKAYIYFGGESMDTNPDVVMYGEGASDQLGSVASRAGDVNGDGIDDIIIGANGYGAFYGRAYIYFGSTTISSTPTPDKIWTGEHSYDYFGISVSSAGDVNGDGFSDVIIGAYENDNVATNAGAAYIYFGGSGTTAGTDSLKLTGEGNSNYFGYSVSGAGDFNGDGFSDVVVGAYNYNNTSPNSQGRSYIYYGGSSMDINPDIIMDGEDEDDEFGFSVANARDVNGDGFSDVIVGARFWSSAIGRAYIYFGGTDSDNIPDIVLDRYSEGGMRFGWSVASAGDVNADGYYDILIGAPIALSQRGKAFLYKFSATGIDIADYIINSPEEDIGFGNSVSNAGDVNGDGFDDAIIGAPDADWGVGPRGMGYIYFGGDINNMQELPPFFFVSESNFGYSVSGAGDVNGDGFDDVLIGDPNFNLGGGEYNHGKVALFLGGSEMDSLPYGFYFGELEDQLGTSVSSAGDVNGDGYDDIIFGSPYKYGNDGIVNLYFGEASGFPLTNIVLSGFTDDFLGISVSGAGDVNGDGFDDVIVGASHNSTAGNSAGAAYLYYGGTYMDINRDLVFLGEDENDLFGSVVSGAGDVNNDGFSDIIIGSPYDDAGGLYAGRVYIYFGGLTMDINPDVIVTGKSGEHLGCSVDRAGDVNGDGFSDVIIGASGNNDIGIGAGKSYILFGSSSMDSNVDIVMNGEKAADQFGYCVSTAGDYNNDGLDDVIISASNPSQDVGKVYLFLSTFPPVKPNLIFVRDIPYDQGGYVQLKWARSGYDVPGISKITQYIIQRSFPPGETGFAWETIASLPATHEPFYSYVTSTPNDSMTNNSGTFYFRITALTESPEEYWRSNIMYGHSVDNLPPLPPMNFDGVLAGGNVNLHWNPNLEGDLKDYVLYRTDYAGADPDTLIPYATVPDTLYVDTNPLPGTSYYYLRARDIHGNESEPVTEGINILLSANIKLFLEGGYVGGQMSTFLNASGLIPLSQPFNTAPWNYIGTENVTEIPPNVTDWILVELRSDEVTVSETRAAFIKNDGTLVDLDGVNYINFPDTPEGEYFIVMIHRNHLPVMTADKIPLSNSPPLYDIRTDPSNAYGSGAVKDLGGGYYGIYTGDSDGSGTVNAADRSNTWNDRNNTGYYVTDLDLSGTVNAADRSIVWNNRNQSTQVPIPTDNPTIKVSKGGQENE